MSVTTNADVALERARRHLAAAIGEVSRIAAGDMWGHDEYKDGYILGLLIALKECQATVGTSHYYDGPGSPFDIGSP